MSEEIDYFVEVGRWRERCLQAKVPVERNIFGTKGPLGRREGPELALFGHSVTAVESPLDALLLPPRRKAYQHK